MSLLKKNRKMKILIVRDRETSGGGIFNYYQAMAKNLTSEVRFVGVGRPYSFYGKKKQLHLRFTPVRLALEWLELFFKIIRFWPDIVHINPSFDPPGMRSLYRDAVNVLIGRILRRPVLVFWRGWENTYRGTEFPRGNNGLICRFYKMAAAQIVLSEKFKKDLIRWGFKGPIHVETTVANDDCLAGSLNPPQPNKARTHLLYLSRVEAGKGVFELVEAYKILKAKNPAYTLTMAGDGPDLEELREYSKQQGLDVVFSGFVKGKTKVECYQQGSIFCFLSAYAEGMPNAVLEALAMGLPVVSSDVGGLHDILRNGENGFIIPTDDNAVPRKKFDPQAVAAAVERLVETPELYERMATVNWRYARNRFAAPVVAKRLEAIYQSVLEDELIPSKRRSESAKPACVE
jgi:glycosyltransferase involved in cell wall biosynthesis